MTPSSPSALTDPDAVRRSRLVRLRRSLCSSSGRDLPAGTLLAVAGIWDDRHPDGHVDHRVSLDDGAGGRLTLWLGEQQISAATATSATEGTLAELPVLVGHLSCEHHLAAVSGLTLERMQAFAITICRGVVGGCRATVLVDGETVWHGLVAEADEPALVELVRQHVLATVAP